MKKEEEEIQIVYKATIFRKCQLQILLMSFEIAAKYSVIIILKLGYSWIIVEDYVQKDFLPAIIKAVIPDMS